MNEKPDIVLVGIAFVFGAVVPAGSLYAVTMIPLPEPGAGIFSIGYPLAWFALITLGPLLLGGWLQLPTDALLGGGILGVLTGFWAFAIRVGWSFVMFAIAPIAILAVVLGTWIAYELNRRRGVVEEPPYGTWRHVFIVLAAPILAIPLLLVA